ncbi:hypothetical protein E2542_SST09626 [Spatholobus suberectus]|nr:hypothetical protein E2542_SST09626 [Spatholobus suberectus]
MVVDGGNAGDGGRARWCGGAVVWIHGSQRPPGMMRTCWRHFVSRRKRLIALVCEWYNVRNPEIELKTVYINKANIRAYRGLYNCS